jgi:hypothetical protein
MALGFGGGGTASISELLAKKNYAKAIEAIRAQLKAGKKNPQLHNQLADVLVLAGKEKEAIQILMRLADEYAGDGWEAKAIAVLKKIDRLEPGRRDVQAKLSSLVRDKRTSSPALPVTSPPASGAGLEIGMEEIGMESGSISVPSASIPMLEPPPRPPAPPVRPLDPEGVDELPTLAPSMPAPNLDLGGHATPAIKREDRPARPSAPPKPAPAPVEDFDFGGGDEDEEPPTLELEPEPEPEPEEPLEIQDIHLEPEAEVTAEPEPEAEPELLHLETDAAAGDSEFDDLFAQELMGAIDEAFAPDAPGGSAAEAPARPKGPVKGDFMSSPLFQGFSPEELVAILEGLTLHNFEPGEIILTQGAAGNSLFILSTGMVRAYVKDENGFYRFVRDMEEGCFFGEFAIVTGQPRAATVTAATRCELLELDRGTLDAISISHPHVNQVLREHYEARMRGE